MVNVPKFIKILEKSISMEFQSIHFDLDFQKELLETMKDYERLKKMEESKKAKKKTYGEYQNVRLTEKEFDSLLECYGQTNTLDFIQYLDEYIEMKGYKAKSHYLCIKKWVVDAVKQKNNRRNYTYNKPANPVPEWLDKEVKSTPASAEEIARIQEMLKDYK